jgi:hypothetical protein
VAGSNDFQHGQVGQRGQRVVELLQLRNTLSMKLGAAISARASSMSRGRCL